MRLAIQVVV